ncbi:hypothetical protein IV203_020797 [Nitzschia inconspicua]|uniref:Uncharacterized protein n=1 Tax=Nitzschia inconspicua TaxID=303405 RepID=A0A9K3PCU1_9STRA|nr:hypothetical protein IV203_020797 [Nitzschia inconspicua]
MGKMEKETSDRVTMLTESISVGNGLTGIDEFDCLDDSETSILLAFSDNSVPCSPEGSVSLSSASPNLSKRFTLLSVSQVIVEGFNQSNQGANLGFDDKLDMIASTRSLPSLLSICEHDTVVDAFVSRDHESSMSSFPSISPCPEGTTTSLHDSNADVFCPVLESEAQRISEKQKLRWRPSLQRARSDCDGNNNGREPKPVDKLPSVTLRQQSFRSLCFSPPTRGSSPKISTGKKDQLKPRRKLGSSPNNNSFSQQGRSKPTMESGQSHDGGCPMDRLGKVGRNDTLPRVAMRPISPEMTLRKARTDSNDSLH